MKVAVAGCSFSDYTNVEHVYGETLAYHLNAEYIHLASGCGSNDRSFRRIVESVEDNTLTKNDLVIIQLTNPERKEIFSKFFSYSKIGKKKFEFLDKAIKSSNSTPVFEKVKAYDAKLGDVDIVFNKYKSWSHTWQESGRDKQIHEYYENNISDPIADTFYAWWKIQAILGYLQHNQIKFSVMYSERYINTVDYKKSFVEDRDFSLEKLFPTLNDEKYWCTPDDSHHMNEAGHKKLGYLIATHLADKNIL